VRCAVLAGAERCAAGAASGDGGRSFEGSHPAASFWRRLAAIKTPLIAAVSGRPRRWLRLALACDMIIASDTAVFGQPRIASESSPAAAEPNSAGAGQAAGDGYVLTGKRFDAKTAHELGLVSAVVAGDGWLGAAVDWPGVAERPPIAGSAGRRCWPPGTALRRPRAAPPLRLAMATEDRVEECGPSSRSASRIRANERRAGVGGSASSAPARWARECPDRALGGYGPARPGPAALETGSNVCAAT
jgi:enoyl-CoA hydratase/carnithine racemase